MKSFTWLCLLMIMLPANAQSEFKLDEEKNEIEESITTSEEKIESKAIKVLSAPAYADIKESSELLSPKNFNLEAIKKIPLEERSKVFNEVQNEVKVGSIINKDGSFQQILEYRTNGTVVLKDLKTGVVSEVGDAQFFLILCAAAGPIVFGACLTVALIMITTPAY